MGDLPGTGANGWQTVMPTSHHAGGRLSRAQVEEYERQVLKEWRASKEDWSGLGKHISITDHQETKTRVHARFKESDDLGSTQISEVKKVHYEFHAKKPPICLARKRIKPRRNRTIDILRDEAEVMERLDHDHIIKLVGTYSIRWNELYILVWPVAVCDLASFLDDIDALRSRHGDREDIFARFDALALQTKDGSERLLGKAADHMQFLRQIMGCITQATAYCHNRNIRHLDLKPSNILLGPGRVYLADFGIAKDVENRESTRTVGRVGTPKWQAPEVTCWSSEKDEWSMKAADVYSLGLVLLNIAAVVHHGNLSELDRILSDMDPDSRAEHLESYQVTLAQLALASQEFRHPAARTVAPQHIIELTSRMTSPKPSDRPSAASVDKELVKLGGLEQVYHAPCCKKSPRYLTELVDTRERVLWSRCHALQEENLRNTKRIQELEAKDETYENRLHNARERHARDVATLERLLDGERQQRKRLEAQLAEAHRHAGRRAGVAKSLPTNIPAPPRRYSERTQAQDPPAASRAPTTKRAPALPAPATPAAPRSMLPSPPAHPPPTATQPSQDPHTRPGVSFAGAAGAGVTARDDPDASPKLRTLSQRTNSHSKLPLAVHPATPIRSLTHTPNPPRDLSLTDSTQNSMESSILSHRSTGTRETSAVPSPAVGGQSPALHKNLASAASNGMLRVAAGAGLGINGYHFGEEADPHVGDVGEARHASASGALSPVVSSSAMSSPTTAKTEFGSEHSPRPMRRIPGLPTAPSWAEVARNDQRL